MGTGSVIRPGEVQRMSAGTGVTHSEFNASHDELVHFLQIWLIPTERGIRPGYEQKAIDPARKGRSTPPRGNRPMDVRERHDPHRSVALCRTFKVGQSCVYELAAGRHAWVQVARGVALINGERLGAGDGAALTSEPTVRIEASTPARCCCSTLHN